jgi:hypothetical protein
MSRLGIQLTGGMAMLCWILLELQRRASDTTLLLRGAMSRPATMVIMIRVGRYWSLPYDPHWVLWLLRSCRRKRLIACQ